MRKHLPIPISSPIESLAGWWRMPAESPPITLERTRHSPELGASGERARLTQHGAAVDPATRTSPW